MSFSDKINQCAKILGVSPEQVKKIFADEEQFSLITGNLSESDIADLLTSSIKLPKSESTIVFGIKAKAAAKLLVSGDGQQSTTNTQPTVDIPLVINSIKPLANWSDREILNAYVADQSDELESQLIVRSKGRRFVVTNPTDSDNIDIETTLTFLKRARKEEMPEYYRNTEGQVVYIRRINDLNRKSRTRHICPLCTGLLFDDHCASCDVNYTGLTKEQRQFIYVARLDIHSKSISDAGIVDSVRNKRFNDFHPLTLSTYYSMRDADNLPSLVKVEKPSVSRYAYMRALGYVQSGDPFKIDEKMTNRVCDWMDKQRNIEVGG